MLSLVSMAVLSPSLQPAALSGAHHQRGETGVPERAVGAAAIPMVRRAAASTVLRASMLRLRIAVPSLGRRHRILRRLPSLSTHTKSTGPYILPPSVSAIRCLPGRNGTDQPLR